jgi:hypothetical protein
MHRSAESRMTGLQNKNRRKKEKTKDGRGVFGIVEI